MKRTIYTFGLSFFILSSVSVKAQTAADYLGDLLSSSQQMRSEILTNGNSLKFLVVDYFINGNPGPDVDGYLAASIAAQDQVEALEDAIYIAVTDAESEDDYIDPTNIISWSSQIESLSDDIRFESSTLRSQILAGMTSDATVTAKSIRSKLFLQLDLLKLIVAETRYYLEAQSVYHVRIELVDSWGNPVTGSTGLMGYYAEIEYNGEYIYPDYYSSPDEFIGIRGGTYTFGAYPGYFDGAGSYTVKLDPSIVGADGFVAVTLVYWSE